MVKITFLASDTQTAQNALERITAQIPSAPLEEAELIVALGGDGFMLQTLHATMERNLPVYGMNCGTIGFLMNEFSEEGLMPRLRDAEEEIIHPLKMIATGEDGTQHEMLAINEVSLLRAGAQAAKLRVVVDGRVRMEELVCDGALVATPAGSTAYNYSARGPILPIGSDVLALTAMAAFRPRRWRGALLPNSAHVQFDVLDPVKRPVMADADSRSAGLVHSVQIVSDKSVKLRILFDPGHGLEERLLREQFV